MKSPATSSQTLATEIPLFLPTQHSLPPARLALQNLSGQTLQQWLLKQNKCTFGSAADCAVRCELPGIAPYHALFVIGARQIFVRALAPKLTRGGRNVNELLLSEDGGQFEIAGHNFMLSRNSATIATGRRSSANDARGDQRLKFTLARPFALSSRRDELQAGNLPRNSQSNIAAPLSSHNRTLPQTDTSEWVAQLIRTAIKPLERQLEQLAGPISAMQVALKQQSQKDNTSVKQGKNQWPNEDSEAIKCNQMLLLERQEQTAARMTQHVENIVARQAATLDVLTERVSDVALQLSAVERILNTELDRTLPTEEIAAFAQEIAGHTVSIEQLKSGIATVSVSLANVQTQDRSSHKDLLQWKDGIQDQLGNLALVIDSLSTKFMHVQDSVAHVVTTLPNQFEAFSERLESLARSTCEKKAELQPATNSDDLAFAVADSEANRELWIAGELASLQAIQNLQSLPESHLPSTDFANLDDMPLQADFGQADYGQAVEFDTATNTDEDWTAGHQSYDSSSELWGVDPASHNDNYTSNHLGDESADNQFEYGEYEPIQSVDQIFVDSSSTQNSESASYDLPGPSAEFDSGFSDSAGELDSQLRSTDSPEFFYEDVDPVETTVASNDLAEANWNDSEPTAEEQQAAPEQFFQNWSVDPPVDEFHQAENLPGEVDFYEENPGDQGLYSNNVDHYEPSFLPQGHQADSGLLAVDDGDADDNSGYQAQIQLDSWSADDSEDYNQLDNSAETDEVRPELPSWWVAEEDEASAPADTISSTSDEFPTADLLTADLAERADQSPNALLFGVAFDDRSQTDSPETSDYLFDDVSIPSQDRDSESLLLDLETQSDSQRALQPNLEPELPEELQAAELKQVQAPVKEEEEFFGLTSFENGAIVEEATQANIEKFEAAKPILDVKNEFPFPEPVAHDQDRNSFEEPGDGLFGLELPAETTDRSIEAEQSEQSEPDDLILAADAEIPPTKLGDFPEDPLEEDSVEDYMRKLLARMRGVPEEEVELPKSAKAAEQKAAPKPAPIVPVAEQAMPNETAQSQSPAPTETRSQIVTRHSMDATEPFDPEKYMPRALAPEQTRSLAAMRELANSSARNAIHKSARQRHVSGIVLKATVALVGLAVGSILVFINGLNLNIGLVATVASFLVAGIWGYDAVTSIKPLMQGDSAHKAQSSGKAKISAAVAPTDGSDTTDDLETQDLSS